MSATMLKSNFTNGTSLLTMNASGPSSDNSQYDKNVRVTVLCVAFVLALLGNGLVCLWMCKYWKAPRRRMNYFILNLTISDLMVATIAMLSQIIIDSLDGVWYAGTGFCKIFKLAQTYSMTSSSYILAAMAIDRHQAIVKPLACPFRVRKIIGAAWVFALIPSLPCAMVFQVKENPISGVPSCASVLIKHKNSTEDEEAEAYYKTIYVMLVCVWVFIIPFLIICVAYMKMLVCIWRKAGCVSCAVCRKLKPASKSGSNLFSFYRKGTSEQQIALSSVQNSSIPKAKYKTLRMTVVIVLAFIIFNLPYYLITLMFLFGGSEIQTLLKAHLSLVSIMQTAVAANSAVNPYIFLVFNLTLKQFMFWKTSYSDATSVVVSGNDRPAKTTSSTVAFDCRVYMNGCSSKTVLAGSQTLGNTCTGTPSSGTASSPFLDLSTSK